MVNYSILFMKAIYIYSKFDQAEKTLLKDYFSNENTLFFHDEILENMQFDTFLTCDYCLGNVPLDWCLASKNLKWIQLHSAGIDPYNKLVNPSFQITNLRGYFAESVAETTLAGILSFYRGLDRLQALQLKNQWVGNILRSSLLKLHRKNIWILGGGSIANKFIDLVHPFGCNVKQSRLSELIMNAHSPDYFKNKAEKIDIMVLILPEVPEMTHYINIETLALLSPITLIVNSGRGTTINTADLKEALINKQIQGAVLDVTEIEPLPADDSLWQMPNVILTQHTSGGWEGENIGKVDFFIENFKLLKAGKPLENIVNIARGY